MILSLIGLVCFILFLIAAFEILMSGRPLGEKVLWLLIIFIFPLLGVLIYYLFGRKK